MTILTWPYFGEIMAFFTAIFWAMAVIFFKKSGETVHPIGLNIFKGLLSLILVGLTMWLAGNEFLFDCPRNDYLMLLLSGVIGIGLADTLFFHSLNLLGAGLSAIVDCMYSPFVISLSMIFLGESMSAVQILGVFLIIVAVLTATHPKHSAHVSRKNLIWGMFWGITAMGCMAISIVMVKPILHKAPLLWITQIRTIGGLVSLAIIVGLLKDKRRILKSVFSAREWKYMFPASFLGNYVSLILWMAGMKYAQASTAAALNQTSNVFIFVFAAIFLKEAITREKTIGITLALIGVLLVTFT